MALLLSAERARLERKYPRARVLYRQAGERAAEQGFTHHAALALERAAHLQRLHHGPPDRDLLLEKAIELYRNWGAPGKAEHLKMQLTKR